MSVSRTLSRHRVRAVGELQDVGRSGGFLGRSSDGHATARFSDLISPPGAKVRTPSFAEIDLAPIGFGTSVNRRHFIGIATGAVVTAPLNLGAQQGTRRPTVGFALGRIPVREMSGPDPSFALARAFVHGLRDLGWSDGRNIVVERRSAEGRPERAPKLIADLVARRVDVIVTGATDWLLDAAQRATRSIPIVAIFNEDPVVARRVNSLARPGGNVTGVTSNSGREMTEKRLELLREMVPQSVRVAFLGRRAAWEDYRQGARASEIPRIFAPVDRPDEFDSAFAIVVRQRADALLISHGPVMFVGIPRIVAFARERRLPTMYNWREAVEAGGLMSYGTNAEAAFRQLAGLVDRILKGVKPADLPVERPTKFSMAVNMKTAKTLGISVPPALLVRADSVVE